MTESLEIQYREPGVIPQTELLPVEERGRERFQWFNWKAAARTTLKTACVAGFLIGGSWLIRILSSMPPVETESWVTIGRATAIAITAAGLFVGIATRGSGGFSDRS